MEHAIVYYIRQKNLIIISNMFIKSKYISANDLYWHKKKINYLILINLLVYQLLQQKVL